MKPEICIVGGGLVGLSAALALSQQGRNITLLEAFNINIENPHHMDARSIALSYSTVQIFRSLGIWDELLPLTAPISSIHISSAGHLGVTRLSAQDMHLEAMGYVIEYHVLIEVLYKRVQKKAAINIVSPARVTSLQQDAQGVELSYQLGDEQAQVQAKLVVIADGSNSSISNVLGIQYDVLDYAQSAIIANVKTENDATGKAFERFTSQGPLALLPLTHQRYALVWTQPAQKAQALLETKQEDFLAQLYEAFGYRLGFFSEVGKRGAFNLKRSRASQLVSGRCVLIGNAANTLHPVAGQGFNLALRDISGLYDQLRELDLSSDDVQSSLEFYQYQRRQDQRRTVDYGHALVTLFSNELPVLNHARAVALGLLDVCPILKQQIGWLGMGYASHSSSLMRGAE